jgi:hypothetical protein
MAAFSGKPLELISAPNYYSLLPDSQWQVTHGVKAALAGQIWITDSLGARRYVLPATSTLSITFVRADTAQQPSSSQSITKAVSINQFDRSLFTFELSAQETQQVISGSVIFNLTDTGAGVSAQWTQNYGLKKALVGPGF